MSDYIATATIMCTASDNGGNRVGKNLQLKFVFNFVTVREESRKIKREKQQSSSIEQIRIDLREIPPTLLSSP